MAFVQQASNRVTVAATTNACPITGQGAGNFNLVYVWSNTNTATTLTSLADNNGNTYTLIPNTSQTVSAQTWVMSCFAGPRINPGNSTLTATFSAAAVSMIIVCEYQGISGVDIARVDTGTTAGAATITTGSLQTNLYDILMCFGIFSGSTFGAGVAPYTLRFNLQTNTWTGEDNGPLPVGLYTASYTVSAAATWGTVLLALKVAPEPSNIWGGGVGGSIVY